jgi:hypothetical protein
LGAQGNIAGYKALAYPPCVALTWTSATFLPPNDDILWPGNDRTRNSLRMGRKEIKLCEETVVGVMENERSD